MNRIKIKPKEGLKIKKPQLPLISLLAPKGEYVVLNTYWGRRISDGDVELIEAPKYVFERFGLEKPEAPKKKKKKKEEN